MTAHWGLPVCASETFFKSRVKRRFFVSDAVMCAALSPPSPLTSSSPALLPVTSSVPQFFQSTRPFSFLVQVHLWTLRNGVEWCWVWGGRGIPGNVLDPARPVVGSRRWRLEAGLLLLLLWALIAAIYGTRPHPIPSSDIISSWRRAD